GGITDCITKSAGTQVTGDAFGYYNADSLQSGAHDVVSTGGTTKSFTRQDYGADVGGYILRDKLWFFGAWDGVRNDRNVTLTTGSGADIRTRAGERDNLGSGKLTYNVAPS